MGKRKSNRQQRTSLGSIIKSWESQLSQVIKVTGYRDADETVAEAPDKFYKLTFLYRLKFL